eukprot:3111847-Prymnesium_polylepis.1
MAASRNGREDLELNASQDRGRVLKGTSQDVGFVLRCARVSQNGGVRSHERLFYLQRRYASLIGSVRRTVLG